MAEQVRKLEAFFKHRENNPDEDDGNDDTCGEYWEFQKPDQVELWSIELDPMIGWSYFVHKFKNSIVFLPILYIEHIKGVLFEGPKTVLVHCMMTNEEPYMFTICVEYNKSPFNFTVFLKSLENSAYKGFIKDIEVQIDKREWLNKDKLPLGARSMVSKVRQTIISLDVMLATNKSISKKMRAIELAGHMTSQGRSIGSTLLQAPASRAQEAASTRS